VTDVRPLERDDIPRIASLRQRIFEQSRHAATTSLEDYYRTTFLEHPWATPSVSSLVLHGENDVLGFIGVLPRPLQLGSERLVSITTTEFMVAPEARGVAGLALMRKAFESPHDIAFSDRCNEQARGMYEAVGGQLSPWHCMYWMVSLDGGRTTFEDRRRRGLMRGVPSRALRRVARIVDRVDARLGARPFAEAPSGTQDQPLALDTVINLVPKVAGPNTAVPVYDAGTLRWLLERTMVRRTDSRLISAQVLRGDVIVGWFIYVLRPDGEANVVQLAATRGNDRAVFEHLLYHATTNGVTALEGRGDKKFASSVSELGLPMTLGQPWTVVRSKRPELLIQFLNGNAFFSRLESEWWLG
jgi:hypothetical protein